MKIFITGATGFIGQHLVLELVNKNYSNIVALVKPNDDTRILKHLGVDIVFSDIRNIKLVTNAMKGCDIVFHLAALYDFYSHSKKEIFDVNINGTKTILEAAKKNGVKKIIYVGTFATWEMFNENEEAGIIPKGVNHPYIISKFLAEKEVFNFDGDGMSRVIVSPTFVFGPEDHKPSPLGEYILNCIKNKMVFYFDGGINIIGVKDVVKGCLLAAESRNDRKRYLLKNANLTIRELLEMIVKNLDDSKFKVKIPYPFIFWGSHIGNISPFRKVIQRTNKYAPLISSDLLKMANKKIFFQDEAARELGFTSKPIEQDIKETIDWFKRSTHLNLRSFN